MERPVIPVGGELPLLRESVPEELRQPASVSKGKKAKQGKPDHKAGERFVILNGFVDFALAGRTRAEIAVWLVLYRDTRDGTARTSIADIARRAGCDRSSVFRALAKLEAVGLVKTVHQGGLGQGASRYLVRGLPKED
jgi:hypothetical protein